MHPLVAFSHDTSVTVAEVAFLLLLIAGVWVAAAWLLGDRGPRIGTWDPLKFRMVVVGVLLAASGVLLLIAAHWGHLFSLPSETSTPVATSAPSCASNDLVVRPSTLTVGCADSQPYVVAGITWSAWTKLSADGKGTLHVDLCTPDCAAGSTASYAATVRLAQPATKAGRMTFQCITVEAPGSRSAVRPTTSTTTCTPSSAGANPTGWGA